VTQILDQRRVAAPTDENREQSIREQLFTERYERLRAWALHLTHDQTTAEDLVQDAFVQWVLGRTRLEEIENIDGYLRTMLRNMHFSRMSRAAQRLQETALSIADYDSCQLGWTAIEPPRRMQAAEELHQICAYACFRKESSKAGSILILRFFHNYFPTEIAAVMRSSRNSVDQWQRLARREAKSSMNRPGGLRFVNGQAPARPPIRYLTSDVDLMLDLRELIFSSRRGECLSQQELTAVYVDAEAEALTTPRLAHIVSCPKCLDAVNELLGLPLLADRYHSESTEPEGPPSDAAGGGVSGGGPTELKKKFAQRLRETHEHKPQELRIAVNGLLVSSLKVSSELSVLELNLALEDPVDFVEISSEQGIQLLFFSINSTTPEYEQWAWIELSEGRLLKASYEVESGPSLHVVYKDPAPAESHIVAEVAETSPLSSPLTVVNVLHEPLVGAQRSLRARVKRLINTLRSVLRRSVKDTDAIGAGSLLMSLNESYRRRRSRWHLALFGLVCLLVAAAFLYFKGASSRELSAAVLFERAMRAEQVVRQAPDRISHRLINLEERRSEAIVARRRIEIWQHDANSRSARRLYDDSNHLIAGAWGNADGSRTVFHHGSRPRSESAFARTVDLLLNLEDVWQLEPSVQSFGALIDEPAAVAIEERSTTYLLTYEKQRIIGATRLLKATLTLSKSDLRAIEQTLLVQRSDEIREYRFVEASSELLPVTAVTPNVFEIEPELKGEEPGRPRNPRRRELAFSRVSPSSSTSAPLPASTELEVDVAFLLNQAKAGRNEQVTLARSAGGSLRVEGIVDTDTRRQEFLKALAPVSNNPAVGIEIRTVAEAIKRPMKHGAVSIQEAEETTDAVAADKELRAYFEKHPSSGPTDEAIRKYSSRVVKRAYDALFHAIELKRLVSRFANVDMQTVAPEARDKWLEMLHEHATAFYQETAALRHEIQPVFFPGAVAPLTDEVLIRSDSDLGRAVEKLHQLALGNNEAVRSALTTSSQSSAVAVRSAAFWQALFRAEQLARKIQQYGAVVSN
jgi:RNA polymerase sigma factor (sigma-70 family)